MARTKLSAKIKGSTLLEVIISMVVIVIVFGIAMMIFAKVISFTTSARDIRAKSILRDLLEKQEHEKAISSQSIITADFTIEETTTAYNDQADLVLVQLTAFDQNNKQVAELLKIILKP